MTKCVLYKKESNDLFLTFVTIISLMLSKINVKICQVVNLVIMR